MLLLSRMFLGSLFHRVGHARRPKHPNLKLANVMSNICRSLVHDSAHTIVRLKHGNTFSLEIDRSRIAPGLVLSPLLFIITLGTRCDQGALQNQIANGDLVCR